MKIVNQIEKFKFTALLSILIAFSLAMNFIRVFVANDYDLFITTECESENCFVYEEDQYAIFKKDAKQIVACVDEECLIDNACMAQGECEYIDCDSEYLDGYFSSYTCN